MKILSCWSVLGDAWENHSKKISLESWEGVKKAEIAYYRALFDQYGKKVYLGIIESWKNAEIIADPTTIENKLVEARAAYKARGRKMLADKRIDEQQA